MPAFGQSREDKLKEQIELPKRKTLSNAETNTPPLGNLAIMNLEQKKKPHNIQIDNNAKQAKINPNIKYTDKHRYRRYKTKIEPNLHNKIEIKEDDDIVNKIKDAFGIPKNKSNTNYSEEITAPAPFNNGVDEPPEVETNIYSNPKVGRIPPRREQDADLSNDLMDISQNEAEELTLQAQPKAFVQTDLYKYFQPIPKLHQDQNDNQGEQDADLRHLLTTEKTNQVPILQGQTVSKAFRARIAGSANEKGPLSPDQAADRIKYNLRKSIGKKQVEVLKKDLAAARILNEIEPEYKNLQLSPMMKGNKVVALDFLTTPNKKREERYSLGLDVALPTPIAFSTPIKGQKDAETVKRGRGRPPKAAYLSANPSRFSTGEMSNPIQP
jgi:hypothetical protein